MSGNPFKIKRLNVPILTFVIYLSMMQILMPHFFEIKNFLFVSTWDLFSEGKKEHVYDFTNDGGKNYFLRDRHHFLISRGVKILPLFGASQRPEIAKIKVFLSHLENNQSIEIVKLKGSLYEHIILKKHLEIVSRKSLYSE